jgi:hypothetical protein
MKTMISVLGVVIMALALVSVGEAATGSSYNDNPVLFAGTHNVYVDAGDRNGDRAANVTSFPPYPCIASPAYTDYTDAVAIPCPVNEKVRSIPEPFGSWH